MEKKETTNLGASKKIKTIGFILLAIGIVFLIVGIIKYSAYKESYDDWYNRWWIEHTATLNDKPSPPIFLFIIGGLFTFVSIPVILLGFRPQLTKFGLKMSKEVIDYAGEDMTDLGKSAVDVVSPVIDKATDDIIVPSVSKLTRSVKTTLNDSDEKMFCKDCGAKIDADSKFCNKCGKEQ